VRHFGQPALIVSLAHACLVAGLIGDREDRQGATLRDLRSGQRVRPRGSVRAQVPKLMDFELPDPFRRYSWAHLVREARELWEADPERFLEDARAADLVPPRGREPAGVPDGPRIGWILACESSARAPGDAGPPMQRDVLGPLRASTPSSVGHALCTDVGLSAALLARTVGGLFLPRREPQITWSALFERVLAFRDTELPRTTFRTLSRRSRFAAPPAGGRPYCTGVRTTPERAP
jgi:hypothetical protein